MLLDLFLTFLKIGTVSFGGGYGMISVLTDEILAHGWLGEMEILNFIAVAESTPGPIAINMATFIGYKLGGFFGALIATTGVVLPAFVIILLVAAFVKGLFKYAGVQGVLDGIRPVIIGLILTTGLTTLITCVLGIKTVYDTVVFDWRALLIFTIITVVHIVYKRIRKKSISPILLIILSAGLGLLLYGVFK